MDSVMAFYLDDNSFLPLSSTWRRLLFFSEKSFSSCLSHRITVNPSLDSKNIEQNKNKET